MINDYGFVPFNKIPDIKFKSAYIRVNAVNDNCFIDIPVLFTNVKIDTGTVPIGYFVYNIVKGDNGKPIAITRDVNCKMFGTIITKQYYSNISGNIIPISKFKYANSNITKLLLDDIKKSYNKAKNAF